MSFVVFVPVKGLAAHVGCLQVPVGAGHSLTLRQLECFWLLMRKWRLRAVGIPTKLWRLAARKVTSVIQVVLRVLIIACTSLGTVAAIRICIVMSLHLFILFFIILMLICSQSFLSSGYK